MTLDPLAMLGVAWLGTAVLMVGLWLVQRRVRNAAVVDVGWCAAFAGAAVFYAVFAYGEPERRALVAVMGGVWGARLALHLLFDRVLGKTEDGRYTRMRRQWGERAGLYFFVVFQAEALALPAFSLPLLVVMQNPRPTFSLWELAGVLVWLVAITGEWIADAQLARFRSEPENRGKTYREGLWRYSRHPNYFFESLHWWAYVLMGIGMPNGWLTLVGPVLMTVSLLKISGIPLAEEQALASRGADYRDYQRTTSGFIPWFPRGHQS
jgi:steroid 5-alpha reductase family enzyme